ncbi:MAG: MarR family winged helix-turn-helix transcriptional regulator [Gaiellaceae bacterium]
MASEQSLATWEKFLRAHSAITRRLDADLAAAHGISLSDYDVLLQLARAPDGQLRPTELAERVLLTRSGITRLLTRLEKRDLVDRCPCPNDGRVTFAAISEAGRAKLREARPTHLRGIRELFSDRVEGGEADQLAVVLERLAGPG